MAPHNVFTAGSIATTYVAIAQWYGEQAQSVGAKTAVMPFMGMGRILSGIARDDTELWGNDFQRISASVIDGVFRADGYHTNVEEPRYRKGRFYNGESGIRGIDERSAGFIDWVSVNGTPLDVLVIGMILPSFTVRGHLSDWATTFPAFWTKFLDVREECAAFIPRPGKWYFWEDDYFDIVEEVTAREYDALILDLPRLVSGGRDPYASTWQRLNLALEGHARISHWTHKNYFLNMRQVMLIQSKYIIITWTEGSAPNPSIEMMKEFMQKYGTVLHEKRWRTNNGKVIVGWHLERFG